MSGTRSNGAVGAPRIITLTSFDVKPTSVALTAWSAPRGTLVLPGLDVDLVRRRRFSALEREQRRQAVADIRRSQEDREGGHGRDAREHHAVIAKRRALRDAAVVERPALVDRLLDQLFDQARRVRGAAGFGVRRRFDRADQRGFERRIAFLEIHRHLRVGDAAAERPDQAVARAGRRTPQRR